MSWRKKKFSAVKSLATKVQTQNTYSKNRKPQNLQKNQLFFFFFGSLNLYKSPLFSLHKEKKIKWDIIFLFACFLSAKKTDIYIQQYVHKLKTKMSKRKSIDTVVYRMLWSRLLHRSFRTEFFSVFDYCHVFAFTKFLPALGKHFALICAII